MKSKRTWLYGALLLLYALHNDLWLWDDASLVLGLPVGLTYHVAYVLAVAVVLFLLVKLAWPEHLEVEEEGPPEPPGNVTKGTVPRDPRDGDGGPR